MAFVYNIEPYGSGLYSGREAELDFAKLTFTSNVLSSSDVDLINTIEGEQYLGLAERDDGAILAETYESVIIEDDFGSVVTSRSMKRG